MNDNDRAAAKAFWPAMKHADEPAPKPPARGSSYGTKSDADVFYHHHFERSLEGKLRDIMPRLQAHLGLTSQQTEQLANQHVALVKKISGENVGTAEKLLDLIVQYTTHPPDDDQIAAWKRQSFQKLNETYGAETDDLMVKANQLGRAASGASVLSGDETGLGNHPEFTKAAVETVKAQEQASAIRLMQARKAEEAAASVGRIGNDDDGNDDSDDD